MESRIPAKLHIPFRKDHSALVGRSRDMSPSLPSAQSSSSNSRVHTPLSSFPTTPVTFTRPSSPDKKPLEPTDSNGFLTALAAHERRVLELKEELQKAEMELEKLKKEWAAHEAMKKRNELQQSEQLQVMKASVPLPPSVEDSKRAIKEVDRRKRAGSSSVRSSQRKVFSGSRHTRTLSLLSPKDTPKTTQPVTNMTAEGSLCKLPAGFRVAHTPSEHLRPQSMCQPSNSCDRPTDKDVILETGKQIVGDFRHGLWTFLEDLRQVTVGEEVSTAAARSGPHDARHNGRRSTPVKTQARKVGGHATVDDRSGRAQDRPRQHRDDIFKQPKHALIQEAPTNTTELSNDQTAVLGQADPNSSDSDDEWDTWDTPVAKSAVHHGRDEKISEPIVSPLTEHSSPRTSTG